MSNEAVTTARASSPSVFHSRAKHTQIGRSLRKRYPRGRHADWTVPADRRDPIAVLEASNHDRLPELIPIRYGRMLRSPFTFLRGAAALMACDLAGTPTTGIRVQACGDCHLLNFGLFATPERHLVFDLNDFDETHPAPWEWDLKRLATSFVIAGRDKGLPDQTSRQAAIASCRSYREPLQRYSQMSPLEVWHSRLDAETLIALAPDEDSRQQRQAYASKARRRIMENLFPKISTSTGARHRIVDQPPVLEPYTEPCRYGNQGQRLTHSSSDIFLGWFRSRSGHHFYVRQLRDMKMSLPVDGFSTKQLTRYADICGWSLARAHAKSGNGSTISGYLGRGERFDQAIGTFALADADQTEKDHQALVQAAQSGRIEALTEETL